MVVRQLKVGQTYLNVFKNLEEQAFAQVTDYARCHSDGVAKDMVISAPKKEGQRPVLMHNVGRYALYSPFEEDCGIYFCGVPYEDERRYVLETDRTMGIRPVISMFDIFTDNQLLEIKEQLKEDSTLLVNYGYYPQTAANIILQKELLKEKEKKTSNVKEYFTYDKIGCGDQFNSFFPAKHQAIEFENQRYVPVVLDSYFKNKKLFLSNGEYYTEGNCIFMKVEPIEWYVDFESGLAISKNILINGVRQLDAIFYLNKYFAKEIMQEEKQKVKKKSIFHF